MVDAEIGGEGRPRRSTASGVNVSATHPLALLTRIDTGPRRALGVVEEPGGDVSVGEVGLDGDARPGADSMAAGRRRRRPAAGRTRPACRGR